METGSDQAMLPTNLKGPVEEGDSQFNALIILLLLKEHVLFKKLGQMDAMGHVAPPSGKVGNYQLCQRTSGAI